MSIKSVMPLSLLLLPSIFPNIRIFSSESVLCLRGPYYWSFSFSISPSNEYSGLIPFRIDWLDLLVVQETLKSLFQHHSSKVSILQRSAFRQNDRILKEGLPRSVGAQYATGDQWRNNSRRNEGIEPKQKQYPAVDVTGDRSKV